MKGMLKRIMVYSMVGLMQVGLFATASAAPRVEEAPFFQDCCGDSFCLEECAQGVTSDCRKNHQQQPMPQDNNARQNLNTAYPQDQSQNTCNK
ncbi:hypothetical protein [Sporomusa termitida]|uniref:Uncharacterized protein n=1 Tax=Sporomusa termitida TaxID=2377 RepID=A0A517DZ84_9FIRM|nr:hypothetical protein [Sporomusa termitida]QDR82628.1 hypothetical protein SPTER_40570 [Sporomusa termitida]